MSEALILAIVITLVALTFDFINGFHDAANSVATVVATRVLKPFHAVLMAAFFNFAAVLSFGTGVAGTVGKGLVDLSMVTPYVILAGLIGAIVWDLLTWWWGLPTSSSHALFGGYAGAAIAAAGFKTIILAGWIKVLVFIVVAPLLGLALAYVYMIGIHWLFREST
ncbi:MAG: inorganic phosphate transporter, partial [Acidobacteria bacterium]|nr:inorganic phosphate transporter [Acidobacteriota bacterium]